MLSDKLKLFIFYNRRMYLCSWSDAWIEVPDEYVPVRVAVKKNYLNKSSVLRLKILVRILIFYPNARDMETNQICNSRDYSISLTFC